MLTVFTFLERHRTAFFVLNGFYIIGFALPALIAPRTFWMWLGVPVAQPMFVRLAAGYLLTLGIGALLIARTPELYTPMVWILGLEKVGAILILTAALGLYVRPALMAVAATDVILAFFLLLFAFRTQPS